MESKESQAYQRVQTLYREAKRRYDHIAIQLRMPVPAPRKTSAGPDADRQHLDALQGLSSRLYDQVASMSDTQAFLATSRKELRTLAPEFIGLRAKRVQEMAAELNAWITELERQSDERLRMADFWQSQADQWEDKLAREAWMDRAQALYGDAKECFERISTKSDDVSQPRMRSAGKEADERYLKALQRVVSLLRKRAADLERTKRSMVAAGQELQAIGVHLEGAQAQKVQDMATQVREWAVKAQVVLDKIVSSGDQWEVKADQWRERLARETREEREYRWLEAQCRIEGAKASAEYAALQREWRAGRWADIDPALLD